MLGVIGGSGLYDLPGVRDIEEIVPDTPFGTTSAPVIKGRLGNVDICFLPRHGKGHLYTPTEIPYRANIYALKQLGVTHLVSISAVGSLREHLRPGTMTLPDQIIDRTVSRDRTFFDNGVVAHVSMADPFCDSFQHHIRGLADGIDAAMVRGGTYICIEGPQFSTRAESNLYRSWNADVIGMTAMPEARLAREAGLCYAIVATVTDYDVWHETEADVSVEAVMEVLASNVEHGKALVRRIAEAGLPECGSGCAYAAAQAIATHRDSIPEHRRAIVELLASGPTNGAR